MFPVPKDYYESAYREWMKVPQKDSVEIAVVLQCLGQTATRLGEYNNAIDLYTQSLDLRKKIFGEMHPRVGMAYLNLGNAYAYSDAYENAAKAYQSRWKS
jgi:tetratricopeptide (TPR) repeat protein